MPNDCLSCPFCAEEKENFIKCLKGAFNMLHAEDIRNGLHYYAKSKCPYFYGDKELIWNPPQFVNFGSDNGNYMLLVVPERETIASCMPVPEDKYTVIGAASELTEEQWRTVVDKPDTFSYYKPLYTNYLHKRNWNATVLTAKESAMTLLSSLSISEKHIVIIKIN